MKGPRINWCQKMLCHGPLAINSIRNEERACSTDEGVYVPLMLVSSGSHLSGMSLHKTTIKEKML